MIVRSVRIPRALDELLQRDAKTERLSVNSLVLKSLTKYAEWDRYMQKFPRVEIPTGVLRALFDEVGPKKMEHLSDMLATKAVVESVRLWFSEVNLETFMKFMEILGKYSGLFRIETIRDGKKCTMILRHDLGESFSERWRFFDSDARKSIPGYTPEVDFSNTQIVLKFTGQ